MLNLSLNFERFREHYLSPESHKLQQPGVMKQKEEMHLRSLPQILAFRGPSPPTHSESCEDSHTANASKLTEIYFLDMKNIFLNQENIE